MSKQITELAPIARIILFILGGYLQGEGVDPRVIAIIETDPEILSYVILGLTSAWYTIAKIKNWKR